MVVCTQAASLAGAKGFKGRREQGPDPTVRSSYCFGLPPRFDTRPAVQLLCKGGLYHRGHIFQFLPRRGLFSFDTERSA